LNPAQIIDIFRGIKCAPLGNGFAPHKPILILLILNRVASFHENKFTFEELEPELKKLLEKYGTSNSSNTRNEPFWRLKNDGIWDLEAPADLLNHDNTPSPKQLIESNAYGVIKVDIYHELIGNISLVDQVAKAVLNKFVDPKYHNALLAEVAPFLKQINRNYWWVSQNQTYKQEVPGNFMWSPKTNRDGGRNMSYD
jgi:putative restriction endonuclease